MGKFERGGPRRSGGGFGGGRSSGGGRSFGGRRDGERPEMFKAVCSDCGNDCQVPFRPTGSKPVFCSDCFSKQDGGGDRGGRSFGGDRGGRPSFGGGRDDRRPRHEDREMFKAVCEKCGNECQVPFRPTPGKPVFCDSCFSKDGGGKGVRGGQDFGEIKEQLGKLNDKIDQLVVLLGGKAPSKKVEKKEEKKVEKVKKETVKVKAEPKVKAAAKKKPVAKKKK